MSRRGRGKYRKPRRVGSDRHRDQPNGPVEQRMRANGEAVAEAARAQERALARRRMDELQKQRPATTGAARDRDKARRQLAEDLARDREENQQVISYEGADMSPVAEKKEGVGERAQRGAMDRGIAREAERRGGLIGWLARAMRRNFK